MVHYCPNCWQEVPAAAEYCPSCGADLTEATADYTDKLIAALRHPEPFTRRRAAYVLGLRRDARGVPALIAVLEAVGDDPYVRAEAALALGAIGGADARQALNRILADPDESVIVRRAAAMALPSAT
ncbi:MAG: HEAT repeat domain-containing protein [Anaerolineae bacterium]|nr:HEAT repeat domain-containing protein [Caldilineales bacterium]MCX7853273.1 HEAT repeat domain-containing protein [Caldilineales bacterium]MDW8269145.1 HEAT repeat domain-containing protein [Anaerolineae bacterium]